MCADVYRRVHRRVMTRFLGSGGIWVGWDHEWTDSGCHWCFKILGLISPLSSIFIVKHLWTHICMGNVLCKFTAITMLTASLINLSRAIMTHASVPKDQRIKLGISDTLVSWNTMLMMAAARGWGGGDSHIKVTGVIVGNFEKTPKRYQNLVLRVWQEFIFTPKRY